MWNDGCVFFFPSKFRFEPSTLAHWLLQRWVAGGIGLICWGSMLLMEEFRPSDPGRVDDEFMAKGDSVQKFSVVLSDRKNQQRLHLISMVCWAGAIFYFTFYWTKDIIASLRRTHDDDIRGPKKGRLKQGCYLSLFPIQAHDSPECHPMQATKGFFFRVVDKSGRGSTGGRWHAPATPIRLWLDWKWLLVSQNQRHLKSFWRTLEDYSF